MRTALLFAILGLAGLVGCICGAMHHAMTTAVCFLLAWTFFEDARKEMGEEL